MLDLKQENRDLCFEDSVEKPFSVYLYYFDEDDTLEYGGMWRYFTTITDIVQESADITEGILEGETFSLGSIVAPSLKISWANTGIRYKDMVAVPVQKIGTQYIAYFDGYIANETVSDDGSTVEVEIQSFLAERLENTLLKEYFSIMNSETVAYGIWGMISQRYGIVVDDTQLEREFANARIKMSFPDGAVPDSVTVSDFLKQAGEFIGGQWHVADKRIVIPTEMQTYNPSTFVPIELVRISNADTVCLNEYDLLPNNYELLPYIETTGSQYIETDIYPDDTTKIDIKFQTIETTGGSIIGNSSGNETDQFRFFNYNGYAYLDYGSGEGYNRISSSDPKVWYQVYHFEIGNRYVKNLDTGETLASDTTVTFDEKTYPIRIFGHSSSNLAKMKLYSCQIFKNNVAVANLIPCHNLTTDTYGVYNYINHTFYQLLGDTSTAVIPKAIQTVQIPYYISQKYDTHQTLNFEEINLTTQTANGYEQYYYNFRIDNTSQLTTNVYSIENNLFYEGAVYDDRFLALQEVATYLKNLNFANSTTQLPYIHYAEPTDYITILPPGQSQMPDDIYETMTDINGEIVTDITGSAIETIVEYSKFIVLDSITLKNGWNEQANTFDTGFKPNSDDITIDITFELLGGQTAIFVGEGGTVNSTSLTLASNDGKSLYLRAGYYESSIQLIPLQIDYVPQNQKIHLNLHFYKGTLEYSGSYNGTSDYYTVDNTGKLRLPGDFTLTLGSIGYLNDLPPEYYFYPSNVKIYRFTATQVFEDGYIREVDIIPVFDKSINKAIFYDLKADYQNTGEQLNAGYDNAIKSIPLLSSQAQGIHSQIATYDCKTTSL